MPIQCSIPIEPIGQEAFHAVDRLMLGHAFAAHNEFGRFLGEKLYQAELARRLTSTDRRSFNVSRGRWPTEAVFRQVEEITVGLAGDVGLGLDLALYREAIVGLCGGSDGVQVPVHSEGKFISEHRLPTLTSEIGFVVTAIGRVSETRQHLQRLLDHTPLRGFVWINLPLGHLHLEFLNGNSQYS